MCVGLVYAYKILYLAYPIIGPPNF
jgi:hypothetical protein